MDANKEKTPPNFDEIIDYFVPDLPSIGVEQLDAVKGVLQLWLDGSFELMVEKYSDLVKSSITTKIQYQKHVLLPLMVFVGKNQFGQAFLQIQEKIECGAKLKSCVKCGKVFIIAFDDGRLMKKEMCSRACIQATYRERRDNSGD